jgi:uncharacterized protein (DUF433 family)
MLAGRRIAGRDILGDISSGMTNVQLMEKYQLSSRQLRQVLGKVLEESNAVAKRIAGDVRKGLNESTLMAKYQLSPHGLQNAFEKLIERGFIDRTLLTRRVSAHMVQPDRAERRKNIRYSPSFSVTVVDQDNRRNGGRLKDISYKGLGVAGLPTSIGETKSIAILGDDLGLVNPFEVIAECRWVVEEGEGRKPVAGFQITHMSQRDLLWLREFIKVMAPDT